MHAPFCPESSNLTEKFPIIAGAEWEFTDNWDCAEDDLRFKQGDNWALKWTEETDFRFECAKKCAEEPSCVAFEYPKDKSPKQCYTKYWGQNSSRLKKTCGGVNTGIEYYTLLQRDATCQYRGIFISNYSIYI